MLVLLSRLPVIAYPRELNADEGQMLAQAMRYLTDMVPWRAVDGTTSGPFNSWFLLIVRGWGGQLNYTSAHRVAALSWAVAVALASWGAQRWFGRKAGTIAAFTGAVWLAVNQDADFVHYSSETFSILLLCGAVAGIASSPTGRCIAAVLLGIVPWAKLQAAPIAVVIGVWLLAITLRSEPGTASARRSNWKAAITIVALALVPSLMILLLVLAGGVSRDMWESYILANGQYSGSMASGIFWQQATASFASWRITPWLITALAAVGLASIFRRQSPPRLGSVPSAAIIMLLVGVSLFASLRPEIRLQHHQLLVFPSLVLLTALGVPRLVKIFDAGRVQIFVGLALVIYVGLQSGRIISTLTQRTNALATPTSATVVLREVKSVSPAFRSILVWGWFPSMYVESRITPPTRYVISQFLDSGLRGQAERRARFLADFDAAAPDVVVDSSERGMERMFGATPRMAGFPELQQRLANDYLVGPTVETPSGPVHLFTKKRRADAH